jgi:4-hydroxy-3-methylbut-2-enyl diphosphate reductase
MKIVLAAPRGFCAGVRMATASLERALEIEGAPVFVYHEIVHNNSIIEQFERRGVVFIDDIDEAPEGSFVMFSAHGVSPAVRERAKQRGLTTIDATCPLVRKVHDETVRFADRGYTVFLVGHAGHDEVVGTLGISDNIQLVECVDDVEKVRVEDPERTAYVLQTTLSVDDARSIVERLRARFPNIEGPAKDDICYATQNRQQAIKEFVAVADAVLVVGSQSSSNSMRLTEVARSHGRPAYLVDGPQDISHDWFSGPETVLLTAGASAPEHLVQQCVRLLVQRYGANVEEMSLRDEHVYFPLPVELRSPPVPVTNPSASTIR